ncbi:MAG TPA: fumarylacetoacetate hydrolase family protein [Steroidobacteraceae bacterium]|nr:fumarylacetoacetate hydrolase family protein [Steroidobacteraceae bacterium]
MAIITQGGRMPAGADLFSIPFDVPPYRLSGAVYGTLLNHRTALGALGEAAHQPPYHAPPVAPVLYIKPRNTLALPGDVVRIPVGTLELEVGACVGLVIGRTACRVAESRALEHVAGFLIVADVSIPHASLHRPSIRFKARDGFCPLGPAVTPRAAGVDPDALWVRTYVDGVLVHSASTAELIRPAKALLAEVTEFMTLSPGDVLALGAAGPAPRVRSGQTVTIEIDGLGSLSNPYREAAA